ncbi:hypothetical protein [Haloferax sp. YSMS24]|uniref:hypothetical protein n=1 Tax=Haloferax sp. YSMS24 TaxID=3388425 RepID=UPI00398D351C
MRLRTVVEDRAFRVLVSMGIFVGAVTLTITYVDTGETDLVGFVGFVSLVALVGALLVTYWNYVERPAEAE